MFLEKKIRKLFTNQFSVSQMLKPELSMDSRKIHALQIACYLCNFSAGINDTWLMPTACSRFSGEAKTGAFRALQF